MNRYALNLMILPLFIVNYSFGMQKFLKLLSCATPQSYSQIATDDSKVLQTIELSLKNNPSHTLTLSSDECLYWKAMLADKKDGEIITLVNIINDQEKKQEWEINVIKEGAARIKVDQYSANKSNPIKQAYVQVIVKK